MNRKLTLTILLGVLAPLALTLNSEARESEKFSAFTVVNETDAKIRVKAFVSAETQCKDPDSSKTLDPGSTRTITCTYKEKYGPARRCLVKIVNTATDKTVCKPLRSDCRGKAIKLDHNKTLTVSTSNSAKSGIACSIGQ
jgi:hypothetical protein